MCTSQYVHESEEAIQLDSLETNCSTRWLTRLFAVIWNKEPTDAVSWAYIRGLKLKLLRGSHVDLQGNPRAAL